MMPHEFLFWLEKFHPDLIPVGFGEMTPNVQSISLVSDKVGFRKILPSDPISETLDELKEFIESIY